MKIPLARCMPREITRSTWREFPSTTWCWTNASNWISTPRLRPAQRGPMESPSSRRRLSAIASARSPRTGGGEQADHDGSQQDEERCRERLRLGGHQIDDAESEDETDADERHDHGIFCAREDRIRKSGISIRQRGANPLHARQDEHKPDAEREYDGQQRSGDPTLLHRAGQRSEIAAANNQEQ